MNILYKNLDILENNINIINSETNKYGMNTLNSIKNELVNILKFLFIDEGIITIALSFIIATQTDNIANMLIDNFVSPVIFKLIELYTNKPVDELEKYTYEYLGIKFRVGNFIIALSKFIIIIIIIYYISQLANPNKLNNLIKNINSLIPGKI
jgi:large-conductance mechanosensitive channel